MNERDILFKDLGECYYEYNTLQNAMVSLEEKIRILIQQLDNSNISKTYEEAVHT